jgi:hypothetical protein
MSRWTLPSISPGVLALSVLFVASPAQSRELGRYLIQPEDLPAACQRIGGFYPINEKIPIFYDSKVYRTVIPSPVDRHAQSFDCGGQKGTIYFLQYPTQSDQEQALLFARPVLTRSTPAPLLVEWRGGFAVVSFAQVPEPLIQRLRENAKGKMAAPVVPPAAVIPSSPVAVSGSTIPTTLPPLVIQKPVAVSSPSSVAELSLPVVPAIPVETAPVAIPAPSSSAATAPLRSAPSVPVSTPVDVSDKLLKQILKRIDCSDRALPAELKDVCQWVERFRKGETFEPVIAVSATRFGRAYRVDENGLLAGEHYQAAIGSGRVGEIVLTPVRAVDGVEDYELQAVLDALRDHQALPESDALKRAINLPRPDKPTFLRSTGKSWVAPRPQGQALYLRQSGSQWILLGLLNDPDDSSSPSAFTMACLY